LNFGHDRRKPEPFYRIGKFVRLTFCRSPAPTAREDYCTRDTRGAVGVRCDELAAVLGPEVFQPLSTRLVYEPDREESTFTGCLAGKVGMGDWDTSVARKRKESRIRFLVESVRSSGHQSLHDLTEARLSDRESVRASQFDFFEMPPHCFL
jgi:hypothetical protein